MGDFRFRQQERLKKQSIIDRLYTEGRRISDGEVMLRYLVLDDSDETAHAQVLFAVPKKKFKQAVKRNRIKRQMREVWRTGNAELVRYLEDKNMYVAIGVHYNGAEMPDFEGLRAKIMITLGRLTKALDEVAG